MTGIQDEKKTIKKSLKLKKKKFKAKILSKKKYAD